MFVFDDKCFHAFESLKKKLTIAPILVSPDWGAHFELMCDANDFRAKEREEVPSNLLR